MNRQLQLFTKLNAPYYIDTPAFSVTSGGIRALHNLCHALNLAGEEAYVTTTTTSPHLRTPSLTTADIERHQAAGREPIVVYPEVVKDNPMNARHVVRYLLNVPGFLNSKAYQWADDDLIYTLATAVVPEGMDAQLLQLPLVDTGIFNRNGADDAKRSGNLLFINRYLDRGGELSPVTDGFTEISFRVVKRTPEKLAQLYRSAEFLYTYEPSTACYEAQLCGCPVVYMRNDLMLDIPVPGYLGSSGLAWGNSPEQLEHARRTIHLVPAFYEQLNQTFVRELEAFIDRTQARVRQAASQPASQSVPQPASQSASQSAARIAGGIAGSTGSGKRKVLVVSTESANATAPLTRILKPLAYAPENWEVVWGIKDGQFHLDPRNAPDLIVLQRAIAGALPVDALKQVFRFGIPVVYDTDERFDIASRPEESAAQVAQRKASIDYLVQHAHAVTVANEQLAEAYRSMSSRVHVVPDYVELELFQRPVRAAASVVHIGVTGDSLEPSNFTVVQQALEEICRRYGDRIKLTFFGQTAPSDWRSAAGATFVKAAPTIAERAAQLCELGLDLALVPLASTDFNESSTARPYLEFSAAGVATIASEREPYRAVVRHGDDGMLVSDAESHWIEAIGNLIEAPALRRQLALTAQAKVLRWHRLSELSASLHHALLAVMGEESAPAEAANGAANGADIVRGVLILDSAGRADEIARTFEYIDSTDHKDLIRIVLTTQQAALPEWTTKLRYLKAANTKEYEAAAAQLIALPTYDWAIVADAGTTRAQIQLQ